MAMQLAALGFVLVFIVIGLGYGGASSLKDVQARRYMRLLTILSAMGILYGIAFGLELISHTIGDFFGVLVAVVLTVIYGFVFLKFLRLMAFKPEHNKEEGR